LSNKEIEKLFSNKQNLDDFLKNKLNLKNILELEQPALYNELLDFFSDEKLEKVAKLNKIDKDKILKIIA
jgi:hypothetical protein